MSGFRLAQGGLIDRERPVSFHFDGRALSGLAGDTLASALIANGVSLVGRSFKYHRPRGLFAAGPEEPNGLVELGEGARREPNTKATGVELYDGLVATSQNRWPSLKHDLLSVNSILSPLFVGGFYYKTFMWPAAFWEKVYEPAIRRAAGLGRAAGVADPDTYGRAHAFCDLLVIGAGPAGLAAALTAARAGARVILCEDDVRLGGQLLSGREEIDGVPAPVWANQAARELKSLSDVRVLTRTQVFGAYDQGVFGAVERVTDHLPSPPAGAPRQRLWKIVARRTVLAAGALERPLVFSGNDKPGVMLASAVSTYLRRYAAAPGRRAVVFTATDAGWRTALDLAEAGVELQLVADAREAAPPGLAERISKLGVPVRMGAASLHAAGGRALSRVKVDGTEVAADLLAVSGGFNPQVALASHHGHRPVWSESLASFTPGQTPSGMEVAGAAAGRLSLAACLADGARAAARALEALGIRGAAAAFHAEDEPAAVAPVWRLGGGRDKAFVDLQHDVTAKDLEIADREGFRSIEHLKRYTTLGMGTDQGRTSSVTGHALTAAMAGRTPGEGGSVLARPPHFPIAVSVFAGAHRGAHFRPARRTPSHAWAEVQGAVFGDAGQWRRAQYYPRPTESDWLESACREAMAVRTRVGVCDVSTLGKIDLQGPDAGAFLDRVYVNTFSTLPVGKARYGLMLREDGLVLDDGTAARLGAERFLVSTTTANAARVMQHLEYCHQVLWPDLDLQMASVTEQWAQFAVAGPLSRRLLEALISDALDLSDTAFPYMAAAEFPLGETIARLFRLSFSGELAYELAVPADRGDALIRALFAAGQAYGVEPYGTEALSILRIEKGHVAGGELNGQTTAADLGLGRMMSTRKDYIGRLMASRPGLTAADRPSLVGLRPLDPAERLRVGAHLLPLGAPGTAEHDQGHVTSAAFSPALDGWIALGLLQGGTSRIGERVRAYDPVRQGDLEAEVCSPVFYDPEGERLRA